jgi:NADH-quinone oxidoreductase subunit F
VTTLLTPELTARWDESDAFTLAAYERDGGYQALPKALAMEPDQVIQTMKDSVLRGRGGAGFPTGLKWGFIPQGDGKPHYLVVNADESEPGACKDMPTLLNNPQALIEGIIITCYAIRAERAFIYVRGEVLHATRRLQLAVRQAYEGGYLGDDILNSGLNVEVTVHAGAGAYICGEETAMLDSLEGFRGQPRLKPPFPAVAGLYACPTVVNNVESISSVPYILKYGADDFTRYGTERSKGFGIFSLSGHVTTPGQYEAPLGTTLRELLDLAGGIRGGRRLKFWTPGGSSTPLFTEEQLDVPLDYESVAKAGSMLGTRSIQLFDETVCVVRVVLRWIQFYQHESCGKCTPCREGSWWVVQLLDQLEHGRGSESDLDKLLDICDNITGRSFCALGDSIQAPVGSSIKYFRDEYIEHLRHGGCPFDPAASTLFSMETA